MPYTSLLASVEIFDELNPERLARLARICVEQRYREGDVIFEQHAASDGLYIILAGVVEIRLPSADAPLTVARLQRGQSFGEVALVDEGLRTAAARAATRDTRLLVVRRAELMALCRADFELGFILMRNLAADLAFKIRQIDLRVRG
ncbi:MAG: cyclic nucleotide-binding domain-containing protein [Kouleothrix sp.]|nr:cyclic nucleotide-binding domain-containing protein [Kouleothrix sp.]